MVLLLFSHQVQADYQLGLEAYQRGDYGRAFDEWINVANSEPGEVHPALQAETLYALGMLFWLGQGVAQDTTAAANWLRQAAELNHAGAQAKLGYLYSSGQGVPQNDFEAFKWLLMAARQGDADAQYNLAVLYREGLGVETDGSKALQWFREAASNGDAASALIVAQYETGAPLSPAAGGNPLADEGSRASTLLQEPDPALEQRGKSPLADEGSRASALLQQPGSVLEEAWIRQRDPRHYTIQVIALRDRAKLLHMIAAHTEWSPWAIYQQTHQGKPLWVLVQGDYPDAQQARAAARDFPASIEHSDKLWIRRFLMLQGSIP